MQPRLRQFFCCVAVLFCVVQHNQVCHHWSSIRYLHFTRAKVLYHERLAFVSRRCRERDIVLNLECPPIVILTFHFPGLHWRHNTGQSVASEQVFSGDEHIVEVAAPLARKCKGDCMITRAAAHVLDVSEKKVETHRKDSDSERLDLLREQANSLNLTYQIGCMLSDLHGK